MLLQTNSYVVPKEKRAEHARLLTRFRQTLARFGCDDFEVFEQSGSNWTSQETTGRYVQMIRFRDKKHHMEVQAAERTDPMAQKVIAEFCELINFPYQQQQGLFAVGFYNSVFNAGGTRRAPAPKPQAAAANTGLAVPTVAGATAAAAVAAAPADPATDILDEGIEEENGIAGRIGPDTTSSNDALDADITELAEADPTDVEIGDLDLTAEPTNDLDVISEAEIEIDLDEAKQNEGTRR